MLLCGEGITITDSQLPESHARVRAFKAWPQETAVPGSVLSALAAQDVLGKSGAGDNIFTPKGTSARRRHHLGLQPRSPRRVSCGPSPCWSWIPGQQCQGTGRSTCRVGGPGQDEATRAGLAKARLLGIGMATLPSTSPKLV